MSLRSLSLACFSACSLTACFGMMGAGQPAQTVPFPEAKAAHAASGWSCYDQEGETTLRTVCRPDENSCKEWRATDQHGGKRTGSCEPHPKAACFFVDDARYAKQSKDLACFGTLAQCTDVQESWKANSGVKGMSDCKQLD